MLMPAHRHSSMSNSQHLCSVSRPAVRNATWKTEHNETRQRINAIGLSSSTDIDCAPQATPRVTPSPEPMHLDVNGPTQFRKLLFNVGQRIFEGRPAMRARRPF